MGTLWYESTLSSLLKIIITKANSLCKLIFTIQAEILLNF